MTLSGTSATEIYGIQLTQSDPYTSESQSNELCKIASGTFII